MSVPITPQILTPGAVEGILKSCFYKDEELDDGGKPAEGQPEPVVVEGIMVTFGLHPDRVKEHEEQIRLLLGELPEQFAEGWSFLQACVNKHGEQWTGQHRRMDELFVLGQAIGCVKPCAPREMWSILPGGMPYYVVSL